MATLKITRTRSGIKRSKTQKRTLEALGLHKINQTVEQEDNSVIRGMINKVEHLVSVDQL